jgi:hypothetical protein
VVRTQPSQGWYTGSTPVRAANARHKLPTKQKHLALIEFGAKMGGGMKRAKTKTAVTLSAGERYFEFTDSSKQLDRARKALGIKDNEALLVFTDGEKEFAVATDVH